MSLDSEITITGDSASPSIRKLLAVFQKGSPALRIDLMQDLGSVCVKLTKIHVVNNGINKNNWPTTGFYAAVAKEGVDYELMNDQEFVIHIDHPTKSGAMKQRYYGGEIHMKDKLLTIPARQEFYGHSPTEFTNLRFGRFGGSDSGNWNSKKFLYIDQGGVGRVDFATGTERRVRGAGRRTYMMVAYWLKESVFQEGDVNVIPAEQDYMDAIMQRLAHHLDKALN